jgi:serine/threonine protein kinase
MPELPPPAEQGEGFSIDWPPEIPSVDLMELVCEGGFGEIYRARQLTMEGQPVCCKILNRRSLTGACQATRMTTARDYLENRKQRLAKEALLTRSLDSRYVPTVYDRGTTTLTVHFDDGSTDTEEDWPYFIMEWIEGPSLEEFLNDQEPANRGRTGGAPQRFNQMSTERQKLLLKVFAEIARGLRDAHTQGIVHLDVTPRNVLMKAGSEVKVIDWGIACPLTSERRDAASLPSSGTGSPDYMAPEQVTGPEEAIRFPADVYALGGIGYLLLTGEPPRQSSAVDRQVRKREMSEQASSPLHHEQLHQRLRQSGAPTFWIELVTKCLSQRSEDRFPDAGKVVAAIDEYELAQEREKKEQERRLHQAELQTKEAEKRVLRSRGIAIAVGLAALLLVSAIVSIFWVSHLQHQKELAERQAETEAEAKRQARLAGRCFELQKSLTGVYARWYKGEREKARAEAQEVLDEIAELANKNPDNHQSQLLLAYAFATLGEMLTFPNSENIMAPALNVFLGRPPEGEARQTLEKALSYYNEAAAIFRRLRTDWPDESKQMQRWLAMCQKSQSFILGRLHRFTECLMACDEAILSEPDPALRLVLSTFRAGVVKKAEQEQFELPWSKPPHPDHAKAVRLAAYLAEAKGVSLTGIYNAACIHALAASGATSAEEREGLAAQAVAYLERIAKEGYFRNPVRLQQLRTDQDLKPLRGRRDFDDLCRRAVQN